MKAVMETYKRLGVAPTSGRGSWLFDDEGNRYLDFIAGIATNSLGHGHPALVQAIQEQAERLIHCSNLYEIPIQAEVANLLTGATDFDKVFFCNSGTESVEAAIKLARKHAHTEHGPEKSEVLSFSRSFHGRTYGGLSATGQPAMQEGFGPMVGGFVHAPFGDLEAAKELVGPQTAAILVEPIQGEGGVHVPPDGFLQGLRELCDEHSALLIFDEVQTGAGRTGPLRLPGRWRRPRRVDERQGPWRRRACGRDDDERGTRLWVPATTARPSVGTRSRWPPSGRSSGWSTTPPSSRRCGSRGPSSRARSGSSRSRSPARRCAGRGCSSGGPRARGRAPGLRALPPERAARQPHRGEHHPSRAAPHGEQERDPLRPRLFSKRRRGGEVRQNQSEMALSA